MTLAETYAAAREKNLAQKIKYAGKPLTYQFQASYYHKGFLVKFSGKCYTREQARQRLNEQKNLLAGKLVECKWQGKVEKV